MFLGKIENPALIKAEFIAETLVPSYYFINPTYLYNGDRLALVNEYVLKKHPDIKIMENTKEDKTKSLP